jgi:hypothetical protein
MQQFIIWLFITFVAFLAVYSNIFNLGAVLLGVSICLWFQLVTKK